MMITNRYKYNNIGLIDTDFISVSEFIVINLEGGFSNSPNDSGGKTIFGVSSRYNPNLYAEVINTINDYILRYGDRDRFVYSNSLDKDIKIFSRQMVNDIIQLNKGNKININKPKLMCYYEILMLIINEFYKEYFADIDYYIVKSYVDKLSECLGFSLMMNILYQVYDMRINTGNVNGIRILQESLNEINKYKLKVDGLLGKKTAKCMVDIISNETFDTINNLYDLVVSKRKKYYKKIVDENNKLSIFYDGWVSRVDKLSKYLETMRWT